MGICQWYVHIVMTTPFIRIRIQFHEVNKFVRFQNKVFRLERVKKQKTDHSRIKKISKSKALMPLLNAIKFFTFK